MTLSITFQNYRLGATATDSLINKWRMKSLKETEEYQNMEDQQGKAEGQHIQKS